MGGAVIYIDGETPLHWQAAVREHSSVWKDTGPLHGQTDTIRVKRARKYYSLPFSSVNRGFKTPRHGRGRERSEEWQLARTFQWKPYRWASPWLWFTSKKKHICWFFLHREVARVCVCVSLARGMRFASSHLVFLLQEVAPELHAWKVIHIFIQSFSSCTERICAQSCAAVGLEVVVGPTANSSKTTNRWPGL